VDPITHIASGALAGQAVRQRLSGRIWLVFCILAAVLPDIDNLSIFISPEAFLIHHRGITHSLIGGLVLAGFAAGLFKIFSKTFPFRLGFAIAYGCIVMHVFLDLITSYGTQIFAPLTNERYTVACVFILDPIFTMSLLGVLYGSFRTKSGRTQLALAGLIWLVVYPMINLGIGAAVHHSVSTRLAEKQVSSTRLSVTPDFLSPLFWKIIVEDPHTYRIAGMSLLKPRSPLAFETFNRADMNLMKDLGRRASMFSTYAWFAAYPVMKQEQTADGTTITFGDLRFHTTFLRKNPGVKELDMPFSLTAFLNKKGELTEYRYGRPGHAKTIQHLE
jgi:inner membrane protein